LKSIKLEDYKFHFLKEEDDYHLLIVLLTDNDKDIKSIDSKIHRISSIFKEKYAEEIRDFDGETSIFTRFKNTLIDLNLAEKNCGGRPECEGCPNSSKKLKFLKIFRRKERNIIKKLSKETKKRKIKNL